MYKEKYLIGVYDTVENGETLLALCENVKEFSHFLKTSLKTADVILNKIYLGKQKYIVVNKKMRVVEFIEEEE